MGIVRITEEDVKKNVRNYRIKQTFFVLGVMAVSVIIIVSLIVYYNIKQRALVGALYLSDENSAVQLVNNLMYLNINKYTLQAGSDAMLEAGYSAKGYTYLLRINGELVSYIVIALILAVTLIYGLISCYKIGKKDYMGQISKKYLSPEDHVLIVDDFLANGEAALGAIRLVEEAGAKVAGIGIIIEKSFQAGRQLLIDKGYDVYSLARVSKLGEGIIEFIEE